MDKEVVRRTEEPVLEHFVPDSIAPFFGLLVGLVSSLLLTVVVLYICVRFCSFRAAAVFQESSYHTEDSPASENEEPARSSGPFWRTSLFRRTSATPSINTDVMHVALGESQNLPVFGVRLSTVLDWKDLERYRLNSSNLHLIQRIASGGFGSVWLGKYDQNDVAVKLLASGRIKTQDSMQRFINEVKLLARLQHPNVVEFIGACWQSLDTVHLVVEYMNMGDLKDHLDRHATMPWQHKLQCAVDVAEGLSYLHHLEVIHRDLKSRNVLMDSHKPCKLSDFGISRKVVSTTMSQEVGTFLWAAPEALNGSQLTVAADIYSFGMILSELDTHRVPFDGLATEYGDVLVPMAIVMKVMEGELQVQPSPGCPLPIALIMKACTQHDPKLRPTANELLDTLRTLRL
ncbi:TKL protein kinase [Aphanomyces invadans]|uniref:TKL protein kinase n=1 Tax=Aphanomyces invadans TaxID=157072 RepID=A0A024TGS3_9STRA|nr:TKL protein kinase [Aphanomyces invadans]ETV93345.1 TKL protein kinase [Aphanomyces invadans]|eukprot:XP_008877981.1 TKL protein kinase [Aphanomyces invadans]